LSSGKTRKSTSIKSGDALNIQLLTQGQAGPNGKQMTADQYNQLMQQLIKNSKKGSNSVTA